uniref:Uncharacterized protein n=1 Tax=Helianthus annuus TaxID=4232 RepID=A0A251RP95_HELAN
MAGLLTYIIGGTGLFLIGASESLISTTPTLTQISTPSSTPSKKSTPFIFFTASLLSFLFISNSFISITSALKSHDQTGVVLQLEVISIAALFLLLSILDPDGIENRYYDLLLVPICVCIVSTLLELREEGAKYSRLGRGVGLVMQGMWFVQMGLSFYSGLITDGCFMKKKSRGNFTIWCKGHPEFHRARAVATLQFNCHLALLVCFIAGGYSLVSRRYGVSGGAMEYKPLGAEMQRVSMSHHAQFTLDSDDDDDDEDGVKDDEGVEKNVVVVAETGVNGYGEIRGYIVVLYVR